MARLKVNKVWERKMEGLSGLKIGKTTRPWEIHL